MTSTTATAPVAHASSQVGYDAGLLVLRLVIGLTVAAHGTQKLFGWFGGGGISGTGQFFSASGYPASDAMAAVAGLSETLGGLGLALGLLTPLAAAAVLGVMINAIEVHGTGSFFAPKGFEYESTLALAAAALALTGPGRFSVDHYLPVLRTHRLVYGVAAIVLAVVAASIVLLVRN
ncbi:DoxX family protein [Nocardia nova]|jgi:putative oxidoreductase|uniref:DoxX family protein n=1 Tax=Nocardia nova TaxID=37330 RepID=A0A2S5ZUQ5_9NOCA|nr:DoxX family protein [Nocardia nova]MBV7702903.1 DoxX family protein [Nocardia nova]PPI99553.1 DoxX family protein [Nocardia nova]PPI99935.1 DoxX family protein [Nocardia nova]PPJ19406.1 DoxX family protein [Nocardia nova]